MADIMKRLLVVLFAALTFAGSASFISGCKKASTDSTATQYTCPHHPEVVQSAPGKCPKCNMDLKPKA